MEEARLLALMALQHVGGGPTLLHGLEQAGGPLGSWWGRRSAAMFQALRMRRALVTRLLDPDLDRRVREGRTALDHLGYQVLETASLPVLAGLPEPPLLLYVGGRLPAPQKPVLSVVGSRRATGYGRRLARRLSREVAEAGVVVASGLARGIDGEAHRGALDGEGFTLAVLGCGPDSFYPPEHRRLQALIQERGCVLTEHLPGTPPRAHYFPRRNRIMVALGRALLLIEARLKSGSLTSVRWAADLGKEVLVLPGPADSLLSEGPVALLREGATPVATAGHVLEALGVFSAPHEMDTGRASSGEGLTQAEARLSSLLDGGPLDLDDLVRLSGEAPGRLLTLLLGLELKGFVERDAAGRYLLHKSPASTTKEDG